MNHEHSGANAPCESTRLTSGRIHIYTDAFDLCAPHFRAAHAPAALLSSLLAQIDRSDNGWVAIADDEWHDVCRISRGQAHRFIAKFVELGWIDTMLAPRPDSSYGYQVSWYGRPLRAAEKAHQ